MGTGWEASGSMRYDSALAPQLDERAYEAYRVARESRLTAHTGGGLDASARAGVSPDFVRKALVVIALLVVLSSIGFVRVALTSGTVALLQGNETLRSEIKAIGTNNSDLQIEKSLFSGSERIGRIATQNLGMVHANEVECLDMV